MPKSAKNRDEDLPGTLQRSPAKARRTYREAHDSAVETYGEGERAHRTAFSAVKRQGGPQGLIQDLRRRRRRRQLQAGAV
jgi:cation transport regulator ChaB